MQHDRRNLKYLPWFGALRSFDALLPFYVLYGKQCGLSFFAIFLTQIAFSISLLIFDIPLGVYADLYGRKKSLLLGAIASCLGLGFFVLKPNFLGFMLGEITLALSFAAFSGADTALLFETTKLLHQEESYCEHEGKYQAFGRYAEALSSILGGVFASISLVLPALVTWICSFPKLWITLLLNDTVIVKRSHFSMVVSQRIFSRIRSIRECFSAKNYQTSKDSTIMWVILYSGLLSAMIINTFWLLQVFLKNYQVNYFLIGVLYFIYHSTTGLVASRASQIVSRIKGISWILPLIFQCMVIVLGITHNAWFFPIFLLAAIIFGVKMPFIYTMLHRRVEDDVRASILSVDSFSTRVFFSLIALPMGWILDSASLNMAFLFLTLPNILVFWIAIKRNILIV